jgi:hypothetical protein
VAWKLSSADRAYALVSRAVEAAGQACDRTYRVIDERSGAEATQQAILHVRGDKFVFRPAQPLIPGLVLGGNGRESWAVRATGPVLVCDDPRGFFRVIVHDVFPPRPGEASRPRDRETAPFLHLRTLLQRVVRVYRLESVGLEEVPGSRARCQHIQARRTSEENEWPDLIHLWVDPDLGVIHKMSMHLEGPQQTRVVTLTLVSEELLAADWYEHSAHHEPERPVQPWSGAKDALGPAASERIRTP